MPTLVIESRRSELVESIHRVSVAVTDSNGLLVAQAGDPYFRTFLRSAAKPFQAMPLVEGGALEQFAFTQDDLALACASHNSEPDQVERVRKLLDRVGCVENDLACGPHRPLWRDLALPSEVRDLTEVPRTRLSSNCSGKHTGMLAVARHARWSITGYHLADHPVQQGCRREMLRWSGAESGELGSAVDGCGVVCFSLPLHRMARAFAAIAVSPEPAARMITGAMMARPDLVAGRGRLCTAVMRAYPGQVLAKIGAEGVYGAALPLRGLGIGIKVEDGHAWAACLALISVLEALGVQPPPGKKLAPYAEIPTRNTRGEVVGVMRVAGSLTFN
jgi:L-asparaginase II